MFHKHQWGKAYDRDYLEIWDSGSYSHTQWTWFQDCSSCGRTKLFKRKS